MSTPLLLVQLFNGLQLGILLFLVAAGLTLVFGVMDFINLAHGVQYMLGAYLSVMFYRFTGSFFASVLLALPASMLFGLLLENMDADVAVRLGDPDVWRAAVASLSAEEP